MVAIEAVQQLRLEDESNIVPQRRGLPDAEVFVVKALSTNFSGDARNVAKGPGAVTADRRTVGINEGGRVEVAVSTSNKGVQLSGAVSGAAE